VSQLEIFMVPIWQRFLRSRSKHYPCPISSNACSASCCTIGRVGWTGSQAACLDDADNDERRHCLVPRGAGVSRHCSRRFVFFVNKLFILQLVQLSVIHRVLFDLSCSARLLQEHLLGWCSHTIDTLFVYDVHFRWRTVVTFG
jgi:hypothetical protein